MRAFGLLEQAAARTAQRCDRAFRRAYRTVQGMDRKTWARWSLVVSAALLLVPPPSGNLSTPTDGAAAVAGPHDHSHLLNASLPEPQFASIPRTGWTVSVDSQELVGENGAAANAIDGNPATYWHSEWKDAQPPLPHYISLDLQTPTTFGGLEYTPRPAPARSGNIGRYEIRVSTDGTNWSEPVASGAWADSSSVKTVTFPPVTVRYVRLIALTEAGNRGPYTNVAELNLLSTVDPTLPRTGWTVTVDSQELNASNGAAAGAIDGDPNTYWHTEWKNTVAPLPHWIMIDLHALTTFAGLVYRPRPAPNRNGNIGQFQIHVSTDGRDWGSPVASGMFADTSDPKTVPFTAATARYVRLTALSEAGGRGPYTNVAELNLLSTADPTLPRTGWTVAVDSQETIGENGAANNAIDGDPATFWHTEWKNTTAPFPHWITVDMKELNTFAGLMYRPRPAPNLNGNIGQYQVHVSSDGVNWGSPVASGTLASDSTVKTIQFTPVTARYVRLTALNEARGTGSFTNVAELNVLSAVDPTLPRGTWTASADSQELVGENGAAANAIDGNPATYWHTEWKNTTAPLPHALTVDLQVATTFGGIVYVPRPGPNRNGNIGQYQLHVSTDGQNWGSPVAAGTFPDTSSQKTVTFPPVTARFLRLTALSEAGNRGPYTNVAELMLLQGASQPDPTKGVWGTSIGFPLVPVAATQLPDGRLLTWSAYLPETYGMNNGQTQTAILDPNTGAVSQRTVAETQHEMFCPGTATLPDGRLMVTGGSDAAVVSIYDPATDTWTRGPSMNTARGYEGSTLLSDGGVFVLGGSWSGGTAGGRGAEVWTADGGWRALPGITVKSILTADPGGVYRSDNHGWFFAWTNNRVFHAGPSKQMNWFSTTGDGSTTSAGLRGDDLDAMNGNAVMYDIGKILAVGGSVAYENTDGHNDAYVIDINDGVSVHKTASMTYPRSFANAVVLPDGKVLVLGGQSHARLFSDETSVFTPELWDPATETFTALAPASTPRNYHSVGLLLPDGRVFSGGGGLCGSGCTTNHGDGQIFTPPYLLMPDGSPRPRPAITVAPSTVDVGATFAVTTDRAVTAFSLVRMGAVTHSVNNDQRRIPLVATATGGGSYAITLPADPGITLPGNYMLFALDTNGVPSVAKIVQIR